MFLARLRSATAVVKLWEGVENRRRASPRKIDNFLQELRECVLYLFDDRRLKGDRRLVPGSVEAIPPSNRSIGARSALRKPGGKAGGASVPNLVEFVALNSPKHYGSDGPRLKGTGSPEAFLTWIICNLLKGPKWDEEIQENPSPFSWSGLDWLWFGLEEIGRRRYDVGRLLDASGRSPSPGTE